MKKNPEQFTTYKSLLPVRRTPTTPYYNYNIWGSVRNNGHVSQTIDLGGNAAEIYIRADAMGLNSNALATNNSISGIPTEAP
ncbi:MAG: hypothetical protein L7F78_07110, partial [Syntrophales bacterium LBB04]|nr:hypothetical protein [Syntrophales bacterium LBB04]